MASGSGGGAEATKLTESLQCFYCSYVFKKRKKIDIKKPPSFKDIESTTRGLCFTTKSFKECIQKGPQDWINEGVYIKTANALFDSFSSKFIGKITFHRAGPGSGGGSRFMDNIYKAKTTCHNNDKKSDSPQAPGSFSNDKWNPGDIWMTSLQSPDSKKPLSKFTSSWGELKNEVQKLADDGKVLGISLKKLRNARVYHYNKNGVSKEFKYEGFIFGRNGDFFSSNDVYIETSDKEIQFRTFNETKAWQGEIKGKTAAGGKVGGGNINFYLNEVFDKKMYNQSESEILTEVRTPTRFISNMYELYEKYNSQQKVVVPTLSLEEFTKKVDAKNSDTFNMSKMCCLKFLDAFLSTRSDKRDEFITKLYLYAASSTEQSSYYIKIAD